MERDKVQVGRKRGSGYTDGAGVEGGKLNLKKQKQEEAVMEGSILNEETKMQSVISKLKNNLKEKLMDIKTHEEAIQKSKQEADELKEMINNLESSSINKKAAVNDQPESSKKLVYPKQIHNKYSSIEEAKKASKSVVRQPPAKPPTPFPKKIPTIETIETTANIQEITKITIEKFNRFMKILTCYQDEHKLLHIYPVYCEKNGPKAIILPEASASITYELFKLGLADCIYINTPETQLKFFERGIQRAVNHFFTFVSKKKQVFMKIMSTYPQFSNHGARGKDIPSYSVIRMGGSNERYPTMDNQQMNLPEECFQDFLVNNYTGLISHLKNINISDIRINYKSSVAMFYSYSTTTKITTTKVSEDILANFEQPLLRLEPKYEEPIKKRICEILIIKKVSGHFCNNCYELLDSTSSEEDQVSPIIE